MEIKRDLLEEASVSMDRNDSYQNKKRRRFLKSLGLRPNCSKSEELVYGS